MNTAAVDMNKKPPNICLIFALEALEMLPIRTTVEDVDFICSFLFRKPSGISISEMRKVVDTKYADGRKISALRAWGFIEDGSEGKIRITELGRAAIKPESKEKAFQEAIRKNAPYLAIVERISSKRVQSMTAPEVAAHWHQHFKSDASESDTILNDQAVCFFQLASGAALGELVVGRKGAATRFEFNLVAVEAFLDGTSPEVKKDAEASRDPIEAPASAIRDVEKPVAQTSPKTLGQAIFIGHGKNKKPLEQLKKILDNFKIPYKVAVDEPNLGRPIGAKVREVMQSCNCAILIFTADEEFQSSDGATIWRPSENVTFELGASGYLYENRIVIMKEDDVDFPSNFRDLGYISFAKDQLDHKTMDVLKELIGFGIVKVST